MSRYVELQVTTNFSFLEGASHPSELVTRAAAIGYGAIGITDRNSLAGIVRAHVAAKEVGIRLVIGVRLDLRDGASLLAYPRDRAAYGRLCRLITTGRRRAEKGDCELYRRDVFEAAEGLLITALPPEGGNHGDRNTFAAELTEWKDAIGSALSIAVHHRRRGDDAERLARIAALAHTKGVPIIAANDVLMHDAERRPLADVLICIRENCTIDEAGYRLLKNAERHLKTANHMARLFADYPEAISRAAHIAERCTFCLDELRYEYPEETTPSGRTPQEELERLTWEGAAGRYPAGVPDKTKTLLKHELPLIDSLGYAPYFLTVHDLVRFARGRSILCQGRGSAANSAVCYCLGITAVDPSKLDLLFERFISTERDEPPDIDVDFEHERREEVLQYVYKKYGRDRAGLAATVIHFRSRRASREVGKVMGLSRDTIAALASQGWGSSRHSINKDHVRETGLDPTDQRLRLTIALTDQLIGFPRHLSQHVGGMIMTRGRLDEVVPVENARMQDRTIIQWDKNDIDALGILKVDILGLGMLSCIRKCFDEIRTHYGENFDLTTIPADDKAVYDMLCKADSIGVFQVESRAQMAFLPRMKPRNFYDLVIEVAIVRPGPIQGNMVHPYLRRRNGEEAANYPSAELEQVLSKTLGVPLFQEQAMRIAVVAAGFTPSEADQLRRSMATFRHTGTIHNFREKMIQGMSQRGYDADFAERCFRQIEGFGEYGFPESHAASFALLVYVSAWMKCHYPAAFACALLNSQPMGFYAPAQIVRDARDHGVHVCPVDVNASHWDNTLEWSTGGPQPSGGLALRLGLRQIRGLPRDAADWLVAARGNGYTDARAIWRRAGLTPKTLEVLARADAFQSIDLSRRHATWEIKALGEEPLPLFNAVGEEDTGDELATFLPKMSEGEAVAEDYAMTRLSLKHHPMALLRDAMPGLTPAASLLARPNGSKVKVAGLVLVRQRPGTAKGVIFLTLEDETGVSNIVVWTRMFEAARRAVLTARLMQVTGTLQREGIVTHIIAEKIENLSHQLDGLSDGGVPPHSPRFGGESTAPRHPRDQAKVLFPSRDFH